MLDLVGSDTNQLPSTLVTKAVICSSNQDKIAHIQKYIVANRDKKIIVFAETKGECQDFQSFGFANFLPIHGDLAQREREAALRKYRAPGNKYILVGTDVAARGLDVDDIDVVMQMGCHDVE